MKTIKWEDFIKETERNRMVYEAENKLKFEKYLTSLKGLLTLEIVIGFMAAFLLYTRFGMAELQRIVLSWIIGITLVMTIVTAMINRYKRIFHL